MHSTGSMLYTILERLRAYLDEPALDAKYSNNFMVDHLISPSMVEVLSRLSMTYDNPVLLRHELSTVKDQQYYQLPPNVGEIMRVAEVNSQGRVTKEALPRSLYSPRGFGWSIEGNLISFMPYPTTAETFDIFYIPNGDFRVCYMDGSTTAKGGRLDGTRKTLTIATSTTPAPTLGALDLRENSYAGGILRLWNDANTVVEERVISSYDVKVGGGSEKTITVRSAFTSDIEAGGTDDLRFELIPSGFQSLWQAVTASAAIKLGTMRSISQKQMQYLILQYKSAIKTIGDNLSYMQNRIPKHFDKQTVDNRLGWHILD